MEDMRAQLTRLLSIHKRIVPSSVQLSDLSRKDANMSVEARKKGNELFNQKNNHDRDGHREILSQYSKSIAFALIGSEESALAYSNRSVILLHLHRYEDCLIDIDKAMQISKKSAHLKAKLELRKEKCLELMKNSKQVPRTKIASKENKTGLTLGFNKIIPSSQMPVASEAVSATYNETFGRHLVATRDMKAGEVFLVERGLACLPKYSQTYLVCNHCLMFAWTGIPCNNCALGIYCSEECKKEAWEEYHKVECSLLPFMSFVMYEEDELMNSLTMAVRILIKAIKVEDLDALLQETKADRKGLEAMTVDGILHHDKFKAFYSLLSHEKSIRKLVQRMNLNESKVIQLLIKHTNIFDAAKRSSEGTIENEVVLQLEKILVKIIDIIKVNAFGYHGHVCECHKFGKTECECGSSRGIIFATCASLINHSCAPNVCRMNLPKGKVAFFTYTPVKKGEQLCDSYGPTVGVPRESRKEFLKTNFFFTCKCVGCEDNWFSNGSDVLNISQKWDENIRMKIMDEFERSFPHGLKSSLFTAAMSNWIFDEEQLKMALKMTDLIYKYYPSPLACLTHSLHFRMYIDMAFNHLFGEKAAMPENCSSCS